ncbi:MAG: Gfo/Idh/MocA family oxidoreductase [Candidatus Hydrogenedentes bacterium]|nr:Gfo/Idh/MocA family oxidoreductase [Candidatus Hydrogenedentota bacterium]
MKVTSSTRPTRRDFMRAAGSAAAAAATTRILAANSVYAAESDILRVGLIGCGGRGTGAAQQALMADPNTRLVAMGDLFGDKLEGSLNKLKSYPPIADRVQVDADHQFSGFDAYKHVVDSVDVVLLGETPAYRPMNFRYAIEQGKHCFVEKPVAVDPAGVRSVLESCKMAAEKNLSVVSGLCYRYHHAKRDIMKHIHDGEIGDVVAMQTVYNTGTPWQPKDRQPEWTDMEYQNRNWYFYNWLSGDFNVEQHIHSLDKLAWVMGDEPPVRIWANGGRAVRTDEKYGNIYDHFNTVYEYANGVRGYSSCRQWDNTDTEVSDTIMGTLGVAQLMTHEITRRDGKNWAHVPTDKDDMYQNEHNEFFAAIRKGTPINNGEYMCKSTLMGIAARMAAYTGKILTWEEAWNSPLNLMPEKLEFGPAPQTPIARPGETKLPEPMAQ